MNPISLRTLCSDAPPRSLVGDPADRTVSAVFCDSREAAKHGHGGLFVCVAGASFDGHGFAPSVYEAGCRLFAVSHPLDLPPDALQLVYDDTRTALALLSASFYGHPSRELSVVGITGTKGKTTTALVAHSLLNATGIPTGYIGTSGIRYGDRFVESPNTTPESLILQRTMREMADCGVRVLVMEVSSQALMQNRVLGVTFAATLFTNLSEDHIGKNEHPDFESYRLEKRKLFTAFDVKTVLLNADDPYAAGMLGDTAARVETFSVTGSRPLDASLPPPTLTASQVAPTTLADGRPGIAFTLGTENGDRIPVLLPLPGICNVHNALAALMICRAVGISPADLTDPLAEVSVAGRCEAVPTGNGVQVLIDYAHNAVSLEAILTTLRPYAKKRLIVLFGSVGGRTQNRRRPMGEVAARLADLAILTSDNPDREPPMQILEDIRKGMPQSFPSALIPDRRKAIEYGLRIAEAGDLLLLAGKGHETYQLVNGEKLPFSEREIVTELLGSMGSKV